MKTTILSLVTAALLSLAAIANGRHLDAADFLAIAFTTALFAWTIAQYGSAPRTLTPAKRIYLPIAVSRPHAAHTAVQQVA